MKYNCGDIVEHEKYGSGLVKQRWLSASGVNELYGVLFIKGLSTDGVKRVIGSELSLVRSVSPGSKLPVTGTPVNRCSEKIARSGFRIA